MICFSNIFSNIFLIVEETINQCCTWIGGNEGKKPLKKEKID
jgi:hypothetical protein